MEARGRGRARGRARGAQQGQPAAPGPRPGAPPGQQQAWGGGRPGGPPPGQAAGAPPPQQQAGPQGAWGRPQQLGPAPQQAAAAAGGQHQWARPPAPTSVQQQALGRGSRQGGGDDTGVTTEGKQVFPGSGEQPQDKRGGGHGGVRGRTNRNEIISTRPSHITSKKGTDGAIIRLKSNFFPLLKAGSWGLKQYRVDFSTDLDDTKIRKKLLRTGMIGKNIIAYLFDGTVMYTTFTILPDPLEVFVEAENGEKVRITIRMVGDVAWGDFHYLQLFNLIIRKCLYLMKLELIGRNYFDPKSKVTIHDHNLELWPGYFTSMRQHERDILLNVDQTFKVMRTDTVYDLMLECRGQDARQEFQNRVLGSIVLTDYNNKTYRIDDVDFNSTPNSTFSKRDGSQISYAQYFKDRYNLNITNMNQPMLVSRSKPREIRAGMPEVVYLVPSLCTMTGLTDRQRDNFQLMKALGEHTRVGPDKRMRNLEVFSRRLQACPEAIADIKRWDLQLATQIVELDGRVLPEETLLGRQNIKIPAGQEADWTRQLRSNPMFNAGKLEFLAVITPTRFQQNAGEFANCVVKAGRGMSFNIPKFKLYGMPDDRTHSYLNMLDNAMKEQPSLIMCILPNNSADRYNAIKKKCYIDRAMPCQVLLAKNLTAKGVMSIATKVAIQMCCKVGGAPWSCSSPPGLMVVGYDVCRDTANRGKSFAGMVASMDPGFSRYYSHTVQHEHEQELSSNIASFLMLACAKYKEVNGTYPLRILIYRDGVGDGQIPYVKEHEVDVIKKRLGEEIYKNQDLRMAFIIVSKRINTKFFRVNPGGIRDRPDFNPPPGTVVDDVVTLPERYDFYIVSQCVRQGTVGPTSYNVIEDTLGIDPNRLQRFTYKMTHMYFNWSGTVRVPAPCQYAHKLAFLTAQSLHRSANRGLENLLYYL